MGGLALWKLRILVALVLSSITITAAMRPGVNAFARYRVPRTIGLPLHHLVLVGLAGLFLSFVVPCAHAPSAALRPRMWH